MKKIALSLFMGMVVVGCVEPGNSSSTAALESTLAAGQKSAEQVEYTKMVLEAKAKQKRAAAVGGEWRDIGKDLKSAGKAAEEGDYAKAIRLAKKAKTQGEMGYNQALEQKNAGNPSYMR